MSKRAESGKSGDSLLANETEGAKTLLLLLSKETRATWTFGRLGFNSNTAWVGYWEGRVIWDVGS